MANDTVWRTTTGGGSPWVELWPLDPNPQIHLHGLGLYVPSGDTGTANAVLYVGSGYGNWGSFTAENKVWKTTDGGSTWTDVTPGPSFNGFPQPAAGTCTADATQTGCSSLYSMAVHPTNPNIVYVGTFGSENDAGKTIVGKGIGVVRSTNGGTSWQQINAGLPTAPCPAQDPLVPCSHFVGTVIMDKATPTPNVYIATLNGIYTMPANGSSWTRISGDIPNPRFEAIAVDSDNSNILYAGTSELPGSQPRIYKGTKTLGVWSWESMTLPSLSTLEATRAWSDRFRVRDIQVRNTVTGQPKAYAVIEGSGIYVYQP